MTEISFKNNSEEAFAKVLIATCEEPLTYGIAGGLISRSTFNSLKALAERQDAEKEHKTPIVVLDNVTEVVVLARTCPKKTTSSSLQNLGGKIYGKISSYKSAVINARHLPKTSFSAQDIANNLGLGIEMGAYSFDKYHTTKKAEEYAQLESVYMTSKDELSAKDYEPTKALANAVRYARDLTNEPSNELTPEIYANDIKRLEHLGLKVTLLNQNELKKKGFNMLLSVSQGSVNDPYVAILEYRGNKKSKEWDVALVGKGVTFDAGGISLKPAGGMWDMKQDMAGSAVVVSSLKAACQQKLNLNVVGIVGLVENMPSGSATRPGDIVSSLSGKTVEVLNTDAEGRLVLGDCLTYVEREYAPKQIVDMATLTGAIIVSLGNEIAGLFSNDDKLSANLLEAGTQSGEELWRLPINDRYRAMVKSDIADLKNISAGRSAGSITAACFLENFVLNKTPWAHLDIAGMDKVEKAKPLYPAGASGFGVLLINKFLNNLAKN